MNPVGMEQKEKEDEVGYYLPCLLAKPRDLAGLQRYSPGLTSEAEAKQDGLSALRLTGREGGKQERTAKRATRAKHAARVEKKKPVAGGHYIQVACK